MYSIYTKYTIYSMSTTKLLAVEGTHCIVLLKNSERYFVTADMLQRPYCIRSGNRSNMCGLVVTCGFSSKAVPVGGCSVGVCHIFPPALVRDYT